MFKRISMILVLLLALIGLIGCVTTPKLITEGFKTISISEIGIEISIPEGAPDFQKFPTSTLGSKIYPNGNGILILESLNKEFTTDVITVIVKKGNKISIVAVQVTYCPAGLNNIDPNKPIEDQFKTENYEDLSFVKGGNISGKLFRVNKASSSIDYAKFLSGNEI